MHSRNLSALLGPRFDIVAQDGARALQALDLPAEAAVLDVGTGSGNFAIYLASQGYQVLTGEPSTDASPYSGRDWAASAVQAGVRERITFVPFDAARLPFAAATFDAVFFCGVLHHIAADVRRDVFREAWRVTRSPGAVVFLEPRPALLEQIRRDDPAHPPAAVPTESRSDPAIPERRIAGAWMDLYLYDKPAVRDAQRP